MYSTVQLYRSSSLTDLSIASIQGTPDIRHQTSDFRLQTLHRVKCWARVPRLKRNVPQIVVGDLNFHYLEEGPNSTKQFFINQNYSQLIIEPTHIEGNIIDQAYVKDESGLLEITAEIQTKYYTDHRGIALIVKHGEKWTYNNFLFD